MQYFNCPTTSIFKRVNVHVHTKKPNSGCEFEHVKRNSKPSIEKGTKLYLSMKRKITIKSKPNTRAVAEKNGCKLTLKN